MLNCDKELNWLESLAVYQQLYNESPHNSLGIATPFEVNILWLGAQQIIFYFMLVILASLGIKRHPIPFR